MYACLGLRGEPQRTELTGAFVDRVVASARSRKYERSLLFISTECVTRVKPMPEAEGRRKKRERAKKVPSTSFGHRFHVLRRRLKRWAARGASLPKWCLDSLVESRYGVGPASLSLIGVQIKLRDAAHIVVADLGDEVIACKLSCPHTMSTVPRGDMTRVP
jgi:hypothetical protein